MGPAVQSAPGPEFLRLAGQNDMLTLRAPAKVNLTLEVLGRRDDGYHDIVSIMQTVDLFDTINLEPADGLAIECSDASIDPSENLALRAATLLDESTGEAKARTSAWRRAYPWRQVSAAAAATRPPR